MKTICLVAPLNQRLVGGRVEEVNLWAQILLKNGYNVNIFSSLYSSDYFKGCHEFEAIDLIFGTWINFNHQFKSIIRRIWVSRLFENKRKLLFHSLDWKQFANKHDALILFIQDSSREREVFKSELKIPVFLRFTGLLQSSQNLQKDSLLAHKNRFYIFHSKCLTANLNIYLKSYFLDQATLLESKLLEFPIDRNIKNFGLLGMFLEVKKFEDIIRVFKHFPEKELHVYGEGPLKENYEAVIQKLGLDNVQIHPYVSNAHIADVYSFIDCLIINSEQETGPLNAIEAMAAGKLLLTQKVGSMPDRIPDAPLFFEGYQETHLVEKIRWLISMEGKQIMDLKMNLRDTYLKQYSLGVLEKKIVEILIR